MRLIEQQMLDAVYSGSYWTKDNTLVAPNTRTGDVCIFLHTHPIAIFKPLTQTVIPNLYTLAEWPTVTTKSRLRALGVNVATRKGITYIDNKEVA
jgi:hypothetical protein